MKKDNKPTSAIHFDITLDENKVPEQINWSATDFKNKEAKAAFVSVWDADKNQTLKLDLWTKKMQVEEMYIFYYEMLNTLSSSLERATSNKSLAKDITDFAAYFGEKTDILKPPNK